VLSHGVQHINQKQKLYVVPDVHDLRESMFAWAVQRNIVLFGCLPWLVLGASTWIDGTGTEATGEESAIIVMNYGSKPSDVVFPQQAYLAMKYVVDDGL